MPVEAKQALFEVKAREAAARLDGAASVGRQLSLLPAEASPADPAELERRGPGRPPGARNKRTSKLRQMLAARGFRMPEDVLAEVAGLSSRETAVELAMQRAEQVLLWAFPDAEASGGQRLAVFLAVFKEQTSAAVAMLPYGLEKMTPDAGAQATATVLVMPGAGRPGDGARVIEGSAVPGYGPPPLPMKVVQDQELADGAARGSDGASRTDGASDG
jgi:hypothetical protein